MEPLPSRGGAAAVPREIQVSETRSRPAPDPSKGTEDRTALARRIESEAQRLGFERVGFAPAAGPGEGDHLRQWLDEGMHGTMEYMARHVDKRSDATVEHPWARTMICLMRSYDPLAPRSRPAEAGPDEAAPSPDPPPLLGRVASYALGDDYHDWLRRDLKALGRFLRDEIGARTQIAVDTAPILERPYAREAGLGWIGKNTLLLSRELGSTAFLAEILTDLDLPTGDRSADHCGSCTSCLDRCPTKAFPAPYVLDARRCISYLTIEYRGVIDRELRSAMGAWIFGCDICQDVCPWNKFAQAATAAGARAAADLTSPDLAHLMTLDADAFRERFRRSPIWRAGRDGFLRNVAIALGNSRCEEAVAPLRLGLEDGSPLVRLHAAWALGEASEGQPYAADVRARLLARREIENDEAVRDEIDHASDRLSADPG